MASLSSWARLAIVALICAVAATKPTATATAQQGPCTRASYAIPNGGFESGQLAPWRLLQPTNVNVSIITAHDGPDNYAARLTAHGPYAASVFSPSPAAVGAHAICAATKYALYYEYRAIGNVSGCSAWLAFSNLGGGYAFSDFIGFTNSSENQPFRPGVLIFENGNATTYDLSVNLDCEHAKPSHRSVSFDIDSFELAALDSIEPSGCPNPKVHVPNGNFESGVLSPWTTSGVVGNGTEVGVVYNPSNPLGGKYNFRADFDNPDANPGDVHGFNLAVKVPHVCVAYKYVLTFAYEWVPNEGPIPANAQHGFVVEIQNGAGTRIFPTTGWQTASLTFTANESGTNHLLVYFDFEPYDPTTSTSTRFPSFALQLDNFKIKLANPV